MQTEIKWRLPSTSSSKIIFLTPLSRNLSFEMAAAWTSTSLTRVCLSNHVQVGQAGRGRRVQRRQRADQLSVLLRRGPRRHRAGGEAVVAADQRHAQTLPGRHAPVLPAPCNHPPPPPRLCHVFLLLTTDWIRTPFTLWSCRWARCCTPGWAFAGRRHNIFPALLSPSSPAIRISFIGQVCARLTWNLTSVVYVLTTLFSKQEKKRKNQVIINKMQLKIVQSSALPLI